jgi:hypothetical protein
MEDSDSYEKYELYCDSPYKGIQMRNGLGVLYDGMNGKYIVIGMILQKSEEGMSIDGPLEIPAYEDGLRLIIADNITKQFEIKSPQVKTWLVTHYR